MTFRGDAGEPVMEMSFRDPVLVRSNGGSAALL